MWLPLLIDSNLQKPSRLDRLNKKEPARVFRIGRRKEFVIVILQANQTFCKLVAKAW